MAMATKRCLASGALVLGLALLLSACGGGGATTPGTSVVPATLTFDGTGGTSGGSGTLAAAGPSSGIALPSGATVNTFRFGANEIELEHRVGGADGSAEFSGSFLVDIVSGTVTDSSSGTPVDVTALVPAGTYEGLSFRITPLDDVAPGAVPMLSLLITGSYPSPSFGAVDFAVRVSVPFAVDAEGPNAITVGDPSASLIAALDLDTLLAPGNLDALASILKATPDPATGVLTLSVDAASPQAIEQLRALVKHTLEFGEDRNGDHALEDTEAVNAP
jgi:hypothetical protein